MAKKKSSAKKKPATKKNKRTHRAPRAQRAKASPKKKDSTRQVPRARRTAVAKAQAGRAAAWRESPRRRVSKMGTGVPPPETTGAVRRGLGSASGGQSGDTQGLSEIEDVDSESVEELVEEGQALEAEVVSGVENAPDADEGEVHVRDRPEDEDEL
jgi:hypothetical protein